MAKNHKTILVAGGAGFVGSHICDFLVSEGNKVICLDNFITGSKRNVQYLLDKKKFTLVEHDVTIPYSCKVDEIYHLASPASPPHYQKYPIETFKANTWGTYNLLELAQKNNAKFLFTSTSEIYGQPLEHPQKESYWGNVNPIGLRSCYDEGKRGGETLCMDYYRKFKTQVKVVRIFNTYGPRMDKNDGRVVSNFIVQALANKPLTIYGDGSYTRSFQYISDLVAGLVKMMDEKDFTGPVNLGNPQELTIKEFAELVIKLTCSKSKLAFKKSPPDDPKQRRPDISLAKKKLGWQPKVELEQGIKKTIEYFESLND